MEPTRATTLEPYLAARDVAALWTQLHRDLEPYGIDRVFHAGARRRPASGEFIARDTVVLSSYGAEFDAFFVRDGGFSSDVTTQWALDSEGSVNWHLTARLKHGASSPHASSWSTSAPRRSGSLLATR